MGKGNGTAAPSSAFESGTRDGPPEFLKEHTGTGKYNVGLAGPSGVGKSSLMNSILGEKLALTGLTECTMEPKPYQLPLNDPAGHFQAFMKRLPLIHQECMSAKLQSVRLWDLPGFGTRIHSQATYVHDKGLRYFDFVVVFVGERVLEEDSKFVDVLTQNGIKHFIVRSKMDEVMTRVLVSERKQIGRKLSSTERVDTCSRELDRIRDCMVEEVRVTVERFHGHLYLVSASDAVDEESPNYETFRELNETQLAIDRLLLDVIKDRHNHDLSSYFNRSLYGKASRVAYDWFANIFGCTPEGPRRAEESLERLLAPLRRPEAIYPDENVDEDEWSDVCARKIHRRALMVNEIVEAMCSIATDGMGFVETLYVVRDQSQEQVMIMLQKVEERQLFTKEDSEEVEKELADLNEQVNRNIKHLELVEKELADLNEQVNRNIKHLELSSHRYYIGYSVASLAGVGSGLAYWGAAFGWAVGFGPVTLSCAAVAGGALLLSRLSHGGQTEFRDRSGRLKSAVVRLVQAIKALDQTAYECFVCFLRAEKANQLERAEHMVENARASMAGNSLLGASAEKEEQAF